jgi:pimeloyl-ACP methyl ester carboxylesterase
VIPGAVERRVRGAGVELAVAEAGEHDRPTVLLVHGYPDTKEVWSEVVVHLADRFHIVAYDVRGAGGSTAPKGVAGYDLERLADDAAAVIDATSPGRPVHLAGHDWGSIQGWEFATSARFDGLLASFTSISGPCLDHAGHWLREGMKRPRMQRLALAAAQVRRSWYIAAFHVPGLPGVLWRTALAHAWPGILHRREGVLPAAGHPAPSLAGDAARGVLLYRRNLLRRLLRPRADATARVPVQLIVPLRDRFVSPDIHDELERWVPSLRRRTVDAGHWLPRSHPELLARWIAEFVDDVERGGADRFHA